VSYQNYADDEELSLVHNTQRCLDSALVLLSYRMRSQSELEKRLIARGFDEQKVTRVVTRLKELNMLNDKIFAEQWVSCRSHQSQRILKRELNIKGISEDIINTISMGDDEQKVRALAQKKMRTLSVLEPVQAKRKLYSYLQRRGFNNDTITVILREFFHDGAQ